MADPALSSVDDARWVSRFTREYLLGVPLVGHGDNKQVCCHPDRFRLVDRANGDRSPHRPVVDRLQPL